MIKTFRVKNASGRYQNLFAADSREDALEQMSKLFDYENYAELCADVPAPEGGLSVEEVEMIEVHPGNPGVNAPVRTVYCADWTPCIDGQIMDDNYGVLGMAQAKADKPAIGGKVLSWSKNWRSGIQAFANGKKWWVYKYGSSSPFEPERKGKASSHAKARIAAENAAKDLILRSRLD